jgi:hypothetical protein
MTLPNVFQIKRISEVFQGLVDLIEDNNDQCSEGISVPEHIQALVLNLQVAHETFETGIEEFMHSEKQDHSEVKTVERIIEKCPYYLTVEDDDGDLPIQNAARNISSFSTLVPLLAKAGIQHGVGGEHGRGGLLVRDSDNCPAICRITRNGHVDAMKALISATPPLLKKSDVYEFYLIHIATLGNNLEMIKMMIEIDPAAVYKTWSSGELPISDAKSLDAFKLLLQSGVEYDPKHSSIGGLFAKDNNGIIPINRIVKRFGKENTMECIRQCLSPNKDIPILHKVIIHTPEYIYDIMTSFPDACFLRDDSGRLPIHVALETGMKWSSELSAIIYANSEHLDEVDPVTKLDSIALAVVEPASDSRTINYLKYPKNEKDIASDRSLVFKERSCVSISLRVSKILQEMFI